MATKINLVNSGLCCPAQVIPLESFSQFWLPPYHSSQMFSLVLGNTFWFPVPSCKWGRHLSVRVTGKGDKNVHPCRPNTSEKVTALPHKGANVHASRSKYVAEFSEYNDGLISHFFFVQWEKSAHQFASLPSWIPGDIAAFGENFWCLAWGDLPEQCSLLPWWLCQLLPSSHRMWQWAMPKLLSRILLYGVHYHFRYYGCFHVFSAEFGQKICSA